MRIVVATTDREWAAPLSALLRERGFVVDEVDDVFDAMALLAEPTVGLVVHSSIGPEEALLGVKSIQRRFGDRIRVIGVGPLEDAPDGWENNPYLYVRLVERLAVDLEPAVVAQPSGPAVESRTPDEPTRALRSLETLGDVSRILQIARFGTYFELLEVPRDAARSEVIASAASLRELLDEELVPAHVVDVCYEELAEVRAAVDDAEGVLTSRRAREAYTQEQGAQ